MTVNISNSPSSSSLSNGFSTSRSPPFLSTTSTGIVLTSLSGILSAVSSVLILNVIRKSPQKLSISYHRIMALMSIFDIMASVCMALTTLPMPSDDIIRFEGPMLGNQLTCTIQGYIIILGLVGGSALYMCLSWYFVFTMTLKVSPRKITKQIEPIFHVMALGLALFVPSHYLTHQMINVTPRDQFCIIGYSHAHCNYTLEDEFYECDSSESNPKFSDFLREINVINYIIGFIFAMIVVAMIIIIFSILKNNKHIRDAISEEFVVDDPESHLVELRYSRVLIIQALLYISAYFLTWAFVVAPDLGSFSRNQLNLLQVFKSILFPLQGFWNLIIFLYDKSYLLRQHGDLGFRGFIRTVKDVLFHPDHAPGIILPLTLTDTCTDDVKVVHLQDQLKDDSSNRIDEVMHVRIEPPTDPLATHEVTSSIEMSHSSQSSASTSPSTFKKRKLNKSYDVEYLGDGNLRYFVGKNGLRRTGRVEDTRRSESNPLNSSSSIDSPSGLYSGSMQSSSLGTSISRKKYFLYDIDEDQDSNNERISVEN